MARAGILAVELIYDDVPPSLNTMGTRGSHWIVGRHKKRWQAIFEALLLSSSLPRGLESVQATASLRFRARRERDEGNFRFLTEKALGDALVAGGWLASDGADRFRFGQLVFEADPGPARTVIRLEAAA